jgi:hypothetical protein
VGTVVFLAVTRSGLAYAAPPTGGHTLVIDELGKGLAPLDGPGSSTSETTQPGPIQRSTNWLGSRSPSTSPGAGKATPRTPATPGIAALSRSHPPRVHRRISTCSFVAWGTCTRSTGMVWRWATWSHASPIEDDRRRPGTDSGPGPSPQRRACRPRLVPPSTVELYGRLRRLLRGSPDRQSRGDYRGQNYSELSTSAQAAVHFCPHVAVHPGRLLSLIAWLRDRDQWLLFWMAVFAFTPLIEFFLRNLQIP